MKIIPVLLSGGEGKRLWPLSRGDQPKQFLSLNNDQSGDSLFIQTVRRISDCEIYELPIIIANYKNRFLVKNQLDVSGLEYGQVILEPEAKNTASAIMIAAHYVNDKYGDEAIILVMPCDHEVRDVEAFNASLKDAYKHCLSGVSVLFGVSPKYPETGYGYIKKGRCLNDKNSYMVEAFKEKPNKELAEQYCDLGCYLWNSGIFMFRMNELFQSCEEYQPTMSRQISEIYKSLVEEGDYYILDSSLYSKLEAISIDYALLEKINDNVVVESDFGWSDLGSFARLQGRVPECYQGDNHKMVPSVEHNLYNAKDNLIITDGARVTAVNVDNLTVISNRNEILVSCGETDEIVKKLSSFDFEHNAKGAVVHRPWGFYINLESGDNYQIKKLTIFPNKKISLQKHYHRSENWTCVKGRALVTKGDEEINLGEGESIYIPVEEVHRIENISSENLEIIEIQTGEYLEEDDIIRLEDDFGR